MAGISLVEQYLNAKARGIDHTGKAASPRTIHAYKHAIRMAERTVGKKISQFEDHDINTLIETMEEEGRSNASRNLTMSALRGFFTWALYKGKPIKAQVNPIDGISRQENPTQIKKTHLLSEEEVLTLAETMERQVNEDFAAYKDHPKYTNFDLPTWDQGVKYSLVTRLLYYAGLRISEALTLERDQVKEDGLLILGKGRKYRFVPLPSKLKAELDDYIATHPIKKTPYVFVGDRARDSIEARPLNASQYRAVFHKAARALGFPEGLTPHALRHAFGTHALRKTGRIEVVQDLMGHADLKTTRVYAQLLNDDLKSEYQKIFAD